MKIPVNARKTVKFQRVFRYFLPVFRNSLKPRQSFENAEYQYADYHSRNIQRIEAEGISSRSQSGRSVGYGNKGSDEKSYDKVHHLSSEVPERSSYDSYGSRHAYDDAACHAGYARKNRQVTSGKFPESGDYRKVYAHYEKYGGA